MSEFDLVIRGGCVVDGTGAAARSADVAVTGGTVREVGRVGGLGRREVDASGAVVAPGFVDIHTHYDGQATWDSRLAPSSWHGVTTVVMGNCGVGFAPSHTYDHDRLIELMEGVEDIPGSALHEGLAWNWSSFAEYLDALDARTFDIDVAAQVPHAALRVWAMGERASAREVADDIEIAAMAELAADAVEAGAFGFTTSRTLNHKSVTGELIPSYEAPDNELVAIAAAIGRTGKGVLQLVTDFPDVAADFELMTAMTAASGRPLSVSLGQRHDTPETYREVLRQLRRANEAGHRMRGQVPARGIGLLLGLQCTLHPFMLNPVLRQLASLPVDHQAFRMRDPAVKAAALVAQDELVDENLVGGRLIHRYAQMYELSDPPNYEPDPRTSIAARAEQVGRAPQELAYDLIAAGDGTTMLYLISSNYAYGSLDVVRELLTDPYTVPGLSDGGAHVGTICDASFPTTLLQHWARDRTNGIALEDVIRRQCRETARTVGLIDRGVLAPGFKADINVIDLDGLRLYPPAMTFDLPGGGRRLSQRTEGYAYTFVRGELTYAAGRSTDALPGRLLRSRREAA
ncbi:amidohydrolase family protein [Jatrophihabitans cynanchi]|uniref:Amidohydrolase family protein n=1 Tax=Jatrophihabitans cynanchi TaxID=2944128 RepID=A0ABY7K402_9ACTN|nr:amidohydrolase family protein [Jatrophihabitans sp. SB3-54]WAX58357.1 amidohydrolase family protein [Jatrophihabitans sp. SB3-54]